MAFGLPPTFAIEQVLIGDRIAAREAVIYACDVLGWTWEQFDPDHFQIHTTTPFRIGQALSVLIEGNRIVVKSRSIWPLEILDGGKNKRNVKAFLNHYTAKEIRDRQLGSHDAPRIDECGRTPLERVLVAEDPESRNSD